MLLNPEELVLPPVRIPEDMLPHEKVGSHPHQLDAPTLHATCHHPHPGVAHHSISAHHADPAGCRTMQTRHAACDIAIHLRELHTDCWQFSDATISYAQVAIRGLADLVVQCTAFSPDHRPSFAAILQVPSHTSQSCNPVHTIANAAAAVPTRPVQ